MARTTRRPAAPQAAVRRRTPTDHVERAILDSAAALLEAEGPAGLTVRSIAASAGVSPMSVYNHLGGKLGVADALFRDGFDRLRASFERVPGGDPLECLRDAGRRYRAFAHAHPAVYRVMFDRVIPEFEPSEESKAHGAATFGALVAHVQRAVDADLLRSDDATDMAQQLWSGCHGAVSLELLGVSFTEDANITYEHMLSTMLRGLGR